MFNRKGQIVYPAMVFVALALAIFALVIIVTYKDSPEDRSVKLSNLVSNVNFYEKIVISNAKIIGSEAIRLNSDYRQIAESKDLRIEGMGNFFGKIRNNEFKFSKEGNVYILDIDNLFVKNSIGEDFIIRKFNLEIGFDSQGNVLSTRITPL